MKPKRPPVLASWLLQRFGVNESLVGDLAEQHRRGRSTAWLWRQALIAITLTMLQDIRAHKVLATRAIAVGWLTEWLLLIMLRQPARILGNMPGKAIWNWTIDNGFDGLRILWFGGLGGVGVPVFLTLVLVSAVTGLIVGQLHRRQGATLVTLYAASAPVFVAVWLHRESAFAHPSWSFLLIAIPLSALLGGLSASPARTVPRGTA